jgi:methylated-DNA-[protein]-cysteine S-methyltransferase
MPIQWTSYDAPVGRLVIVEGDEGPIVVEYPVRAALLRWEDEVRRAMPRIRVEPGPCERTREWLDRYFDGDPDPFPFPYHLGRYFDPSPAHVIVWRALWGIPYGGTRSFDEVAHETGLHPRHVGQLVASNHLAILIPCHRIVGKRGDLVGYAGGLSTKRRLLDHELRTAGVVLRSQSGA